MAEQPDLPRNDFDDRASIGTLFTRLVQDGTRVARAEIKLAKATASDRFAKSVVAVGMLFAALFLAQAAVTALLVGIIVWLVVPLGPLGATLLVTIVALAICGLLGKLAIARLKSVLSEPLP